MKNLSLLVALLALGIVANGAVTQTFKPSNADLYDLEHSKYYVWNMDFKGAIDASSIVGAKITLDSIFDWSGGNANDQLAISLLDNCYGKRNVYVGSDSATVTADIFDTWQSPVTDIATLGVPEDIGIGGNKAKTITIDFNADQLAALKSYIANNGMIALGFDPDCHFYNKGVSFSIDTAVVPAPSAIILAGLGTGLVGWLKRRKAV